MNSIQALIADDSFAISFQSMGQYRAALLKALNAEAPATPPAPEPPAEALAARPLLEQMARFQHSHHSNPWSQMLTLSSRAADWLRDNPPGQPVAIEPRGCPAPGACSCVVPAPAAPEAGEVGKVGKIAQSERIASIAKAVQECAFAHKPDARLIGNVCAEDVADLCAAILARWGHPAAPPAPAVVPVAWCRSDEFAKAMKPCGGSFNGWKDPGAGVNKCDMQLYAIPLP